MQDTGQWKYDSESEKQGTYLSNKKQDMKCILTTIWNKNNKFGYIHYCPQRPSHPFDFLTKKPCAVKSDLVLGEIFKVGVEAGNEELTQLWCGLREK